MASSVVAIKHADEPCTLKAVPNLLPCRVHHTGFMASISEYWSPAQTDKDSVAYFRGRRLEGTTIRLAQNLHGVVVEQEAQQQQEPESTESGFQTDKMHVKACFDKMVVWSHGAAADKTADPYIRGIDEWLQVASQVHSLSDSGKQVDNERSAVLSRWLSGREDSLVKASRIKLPE